MTGRRGYSLVETLVAIALVTAAFGTVIVTLEGMFRSSRQVRSEAEAQLDLERFAARFRADAHEASSVEAERAGEEGETAALVLVLPEGRAVRYAIEPAGVRRVLSRGETVEHRDTYRLPRSSAAGWRVQKDRLRPRVSLVLEPRPGGTKSGATAYQVLRIDATVGLLGPQRAAPES
jgi:type II secretory pathway component PulJ